MQRRQFLTLLGGAVATSPLAARAQDAARTRRIGMLVGVGSDTPDAQLRYAVFLEKLQQLGWTNGQNVRVEIRWSGGDAKLMRQYPAELIALTPDVMVTTGSLSTETVVRSTTSVPIVFAIVLDPVGGGLVKSLSRPGGNATGFMMFEYSLSAKWPELLKQIAPTITRAAVLRETQSTAAVGQFAVIQSVASSVGVEMIPIDLGDVSDIERELETFARSGNGGLIVTAGASAIVHRDLIHMLALRHKLPAVYPERSFAATGGLISYGPSYIDQYRRAAGYVDLILRGQKPGDLPVQAPTKYELVVNLKTAKAIGVMIPPSLLASADEVIE
jgi:putative tryptophan/tyrosine transport system substrate-binding protein